MDEIIHGEALAVLRRISDNSFDLVLTDPPYDLDEAEKDAFHAELRRVARAAIVFSPPENQWVRPDQCGFWIKPISTKNTSRRYSRFVEMIFFYGELEWHTGRHWSQYTNVFTDLVDDETGHPFEKPTSLICRLIENHSRPGQTILDPFVGSGTTAVVARELGRRFLGIERDRAHVRLARARLDATPPTPGMALAAE